MQTKKGSFIEAVINTLIGYIVTLAFSPLIYSIAGVKLTVGKLNLVVFLFTIISVIRSYVIRRFFNKLIIKALYGPKINKKTGAVTITINRHTAPSREQAERIAKNIENGC